MVSRPMKTGEPIRWGLPGGKTEDHDYHGWENSIYAIYREVHEETGLLLDIDKIVPIYGAVVIGEGEGHTYFTTCHYYLLDKDEIKHPIKTEDGYFHDWVEDTKLADSPNMAFAEYNLHALISLRRMFDSGHLSYSS